MAVLRCESRPTVGIIADPGRGLLTIHAHPLRLELDYDEAARFADEYAAALERLRVKDGADQRAVTSRG